MCLGSLEALYEPLSKLSVLEGSAELALKTLTKGYSVKDLDAAEATNSMVKAASGYDQIEEPSMVKQGVHQGEIIIKKLDQALAGIERLEKVWVHYNKKYLLQQKKNRCNNIEVIAIVYAKCCNKICSNKFVLQKKFVAISLKQFITSNIL